MLEKFLESQMRSKNFNHHPKKKEYSQKNLIKG